MAFVRKVWKNRISEFFNRYRLENVRTGEAFNAYINLNDGAVEQAGDRLNAEALNDLEGRIAEAFESSGSDMIAGTEETSTSSQAYTAGAYLVYNGHLYRVETAIAAGDTLTPNGNIVQKKIAEELASHLVVGGTPFYFDTHDGQFGYNTSPLRGADTFFPFKGTVPTLDFYLYASSYSGALLDLKTTFLSKYQTIEWVEGGDSNCQVYFYTSADNYANYTMLSRATPVDIPQGYDMRLVTYYADSAHGKPRIRMTPKPVSSSGTISSGTLLFNQTTLTYNDTYLTDSLASYADYKILVILAERVNNGQFVASVSNCNVIAEITTASAAQKIFILSEINNNSTLMGKGYGTDYYHRAIIGMN